MVAYSFRPRFAEPILAGTKGGTIRARRRTHGSGVYRDYVGGHARPGEELQLYTGMRTKHCRLIARKRCVAVEPIELNFPSFRFVLGGRLLRQADEFVALACFDGFADFAEMSNFWTEPWFHGWHIRWAPLPPTLE